MVCLLIDKFEEKRNPMYVFKDIKSERLEKLRNEERLKVYSTIKGSSKFQVIVFMPYQKFRASPHLSICESCKIDYGSCNLFKEYDVTIKLLKKTTLDLI